MSMGKKRISSQSHVSTKATILKARCNMIEDDKKKDYVWKTDYEH